MDTYFSICETQVEHLRCSVCEKGSMQFSFEAQQKLGFSSKDTAHVCSNCGHEEALDEQWPKISAVPVRRFSAVNLMRSVQGIPAGTYPMADGDSDDHLVVEYIDAQTTDLTRCRLRLADSDDTALSPDDYEVINVSSHEMLWPLVCETDLRVTQYCKQYGSHYIILEAVPCLTAPQLST